MPKQPSSSKGSNCPRGFSIIAPSGSSSTVRDYCNEIAASCPVHSARNDYDLLMIGTGGYEGPMDTQSIRRWLDMRFEDAINSHRSTTTKPISEADVVMHATNLLSRPFGQAEGVKPSAQDKRAIIRQIPSSSYSIRLWPGNLHRQEYYMDFLNQKHEPVNFPFSHTLFSDVGYPVEIKSVERSFGIPSRQIHPGAEKYLLLEGQAYRLKRPGMADILFTVPTRRKPNFDQSEELRLDFN